MALSETSCAIPQAIEGVGILNLAASPRNIISAIGVNDRLRCALLGSLARNTSAYTARLLMIEF